MKKRLSPEEAYRRIQESKKKYREKNKEKTRSANRKYYLKITKPKRQLLRQQKRA